MTLALFCLWCASVAAEIPPPVFDAAPAPVSWSKPALLYGLASGLDLATTEWSLSKGGVEVNPLGQSRGARIGLRAAGVLALTAFDGWLQKRGHRTLVKVLRITVLSVWVGASLNNAWVATR